MGQSPVVTDEHTPEPIASISADYLDQHPDGPVVVRVRDANNVRLLNGIHAERIVWIEAPLAMASAAWPSEVGLDFMIVDPALEAPHLYSVAPLRDERPLRITIPVVSGVSRAARIAMALKLPIRLLFQQPSSQAINELYAVLETYLHDAQSTASVQPFDSALSFWLHGNPATLWMALDLDPAFVRRVPNPGEAFVIPGEPDFVSDTMDRLMAEGAECATCPFAGWCVGFFKWPDPAFFCGDAVKPLLGTIANNAEQIARDLDESEELQP